MIINYQNIPSYKISIEITWHSPQWFNATIFKINIFITQKNKKNEINR